MPSAVREELAFEIPALGAMPQLSGKTPIAEVLRRESVPGPERMLRRAARSFGCRDDPRRPSVRARDGTGDAASWCTSRRADCVQRHLRTTYALNLDLRHRTLARELQWSLLYI